MASSATFYITDTADDGSVYENAPSTYDQNDVRVGATLGTFAWGGYRFRNITIPAGATIITALFKPIYNSANGANPGTPGNWKAVNSANAALFTTTNPRAASKLATGAVAILQSQQTYEMKDAVQAVINLGGWASGNSLAIVADNVTSATGAALYNDYAGSFPTGTAEIYIEWDVILASLTLSNDDTFTNAANGEVIGTVGGQTGGSTLSLTDASGYFSLVSGQLRATGPVPTGSYSITITETLTGATGSPKTNNFTITSTTAPPIRFIGAAGGTTSATVPAHVAGDAILAFAFRDGSATLPTLPTGQNWTSLLAPTGANTASMRAAGKIAAGSSEATGTWTSATTLNVGVWRPGAGYTLSFGASASAAASSTTVSYPALTLQDATGASWVIGWAGHRSVNTTLESPPTGMVNRLSTLDATDETALHDTNGGVSSWSLATKAVGGTASGWFGATVEIKAASAGGSVSGSATLQDPVDLYSATASLALKASAALSDPVDAYSATGSVALKAASSLLDPEDSWSATGTLTAPAISGSAALVDPVDTFAAAGSVRVSASANLTDPADAWASDGRLAIAGAAELTDAADSFDVSGALALKGLADALDPADSFTATGALTVSGAASLADPADSLTASGALRITASAAVSDPPDTWAITGQTGEAPVGIAATASLLDQPDAYSSAGRLRVSGSAAVADPPDAFSSTGQHLARASAALLDPPDSFTTTARLALRSSASLTDAPDGWAGVGAVALSGAAAVNDPPDAFSGAGRLYLAASADLQDEPDAWAATGQKIVPSATAPGRVVGAGRERRTDAPSREARAAFSAGSARFSASRGGDRVARAAGSVRSVSSKE